jgi:hypothetical protein
MKRASIGLAICLAGLLGAAQSDAASADWPFRSWMRQFSATYMIGMATYQARFQANPSFDKGLIIAVPVKFDRMVAENVAIFRGDVLQGVGDNSPNAQMVVSNMPAEQFTAGESVVLAFKILGMSSEYGLPHGEFVAAHHCTRVDCLDFLG